jgi:hypothetical protein
VLNTQKEMELQNLAIEAYDKIGDILDKACDAAEMNSHRHYFVSQLVVRMDIYMSLKLNLKGEQ